LECNFNTSTFRRFSSYFFATRLRTCDPTSSRLSSPHILHPLLSDRGLPWSSIGTPTSFSETSNLDMRSGQRAGGLKKKRGPSKGLNPLKKGGGASDPNLIIVVQNCSLSRQKRSVFAKRTCKKYERHISNTHTHIHTQIESKQAAEGTRGDGARGVTQLWSRERMSS
jgi:hypothetical protein